MPATRDGLPSGWPDWPTGAGNRLVAVAGAAGLLGFATLAWYSRGGAGEPGLAVFFALTAWVSLAWMGLFWCFRRRPESLPVVPMLVWAALFRICGLFGTPLFEDDWFRYLWDGYRFAETGTPYGWAPAASFADANVPEAFQRILDRINYPDLPTIYGPTTELVFLLSYLLGPGSLAPLQLLLIGIDLVLIRLLLAAAPPAFVLLYAWCPLVIKEIAFTAHPDGFGVCLLLAAVLLRRRERTGFAAACLALAVGAKVFAALLVPFVLARAGVRAWLVFGAVLALVYLPFAVQGATDFTALAVFATEWEFNAAVYAALKVWLPPLPARLALAAALCVPGIAYWLHYRSRSPGDIPRGDWIFGAFLVAAPVINPWYALWVLPFAVIYPSRWAWTASSALLLAYIAGINLQGSDLDAYAQPAWVRPVEFGVIAMALGVDVRRGRQRSGRAGCIAT